MKTTEISVVFLGLIIALSIHFIPKLDPDLTTFTRTPTLYPKTPLPNLSRNLTRQFKTLWCPAHDFPFLEAMTECCEWIPVSDPKNATILWTIDKYDLFKKITLEKLRLGEGQLWNQIHSGGMMTDKARLHKLLVNINATYFQPETYVLTDPDECKKFFKGPGIEPGVVWVTKDPLSAEGDGIIINPDIAKLKEMWVEEGENGTEFQCKVPTTDSVLIQRYVMNPLLLEGKKMEIRSYWMVASVDPFIILYRDGTVRLTTRDYKSGEWDDPLIHITNTKQQKLADPDYYSTESERKWTLQQLAEYLANKGKIQSPSEWLDEMRIKFKYIIGRCVKGAYPELLDNLKKSHKRYDGRFEIFGMDVILDENLRPWLTELQDGPSLSMDPGPKRYLIPEMLSELVDIVLELDYAHRFNDHIIPYPLLSMGKWEYVDTDNFHHYNGDL